MNLRLEPYHPTNITTHRHTVDRWFNFIAGFSPEFVQTCLDANKGPRKVVLDPFMGCGTVQVQANKLGWFSLGYEAHPVFYRIAYAKTFAKDLCTDLLEIRKAIQHGFENPVSVGVLREKPKEYLSKLFSSDTLERLIGAKESVFESGFGNHALAFLVLSKILDLCSKSQTDGIYKAPTSYKRAQAPNTALDKVYEMVHSDVADYNLSGSILHHATSQHMLDIEDESVSTVITSPPYLNNFDYAEMTRMHLYFWDIAESWLDISKKVRSKLIVNTTTALTGHKPRQWEYRCTLPDSILPEIDDIVSSLEREKTMRAGKKEYNFLIYPYFSQMKEVITECFRSLEASGHFHMMIGDTALYGVHISSPQLLAQMMKDIGFSKVSCRFVRQRGHRWILNKRDGSQKGLGEYHIYAEKP